MMFVLVLCVTGCGDPAWFKLQENALYPVEGRILRDRHAVTVVRPNIVKTQDTSTLAIRTPGLTDGIFSTEISLTAGGSVTVLTRTTPYNAAFRADSGIRIVITNDRTVVYAPDGGIYVGNEGAVSKAKELRIVNDGAWCDVVMGCTHVVRLRTTLPSTEWIVAASVEHSAFALRDPTFTPLLEL